jgi:membrane-bound lytic murein transglycosylase D
MQWAGRKYGLRGVDYFDVEASTDKQLEYLKDLVREFDWNLELVLVDYNYGPGKRFLRYRSDSNAFRRIYGRLPAETRRFVPRILAGIALGLAPDRYGLFIPRVDPATAEVTATRDMHHLEVGLLLGTDHWNLGNLNPREDIRVWFEEGESIVIPKALEASYRDLIDSHPLKNEFHTFVSDVYPAPGEEVRYVVQSGDNLSRIASRFKHCGVQGVEHLILYNGLASTVIRPNQVLLIPCGR